MTKKNIAREETRQALIEAFWKLLKDKSADKMTVSEIARVAGYNRSTFYEYFFDVPDVLQQVEDGILQEMNFGIPKNDRIPMAQVVDVFERNAEPLSLLLGEHGDFSFFFRIRNKMKQAFYELARSGGVEVDFPIALEIEHHVAGTTASLLSWLRMPDRPSAETYLTVLREIDHDSSERLIKKLNG